MDMCDHETAVLVAGGSGFTYSMATLEHVSTTLHEAPEDHVRRECVSHSCDLHFFLLSMRILDCGERYEGHWLY
jgi:hypothetical protein